MDENIKERILNFQKNEITEFHIYDKLSKWLKDTPNGEVLKRISQEELTHYNTWKGYTNQEVHASKLKIVFFYIVSRVMGLTFGIKLMEKGEKTAQSLYEDMVAYVAEARQICTQEEDHENALIDLLDEEKLNYIGSMVLGLNDALVELTGTLAGLTLALQNTRLIAMAGLITGVAASLSMAASEYLSTKAEGKHHSPIKASVYTGSAYVITVTLLILPFLLFKNIFLCLGLTLFSAVLVILIFNFYISVAKDLSFKHRFLEMAGISLSVAALSFGIGFLIRNFLGTEV